MARMAVRKVASGSSKNDCVSYVKNEMWRNGISMISYDRNDNRSFDNTCICRVVLGLPDDNCGTYRHSHHLK